MDRTAPRLGDRTRRVRHLAAALLALAYGAMLVLCQSSVAGATLGAGVGASPLALAAPAHPGGTFQVVPDLLVVNTGTDSARYVIKMERLSKGHPMTIPVTWVKFDANRFVLAPNARRTVPLRVQVPATARPGPYTSDVVVSGVVPHGSGQAAAGAAAATTISFTVTGSPSGPFPWILIVVILGVLVVVGLVVLIRRSGVRLKVERR